MLRLPLECGAKSKSGIDRYFRTPEEKIS